MTVAALRIRLGDVDRQRLGGPEWVVYDAATLMVRELCAIYDAFGVKPAEWDAMRGSGNPLVILASVWAARRRAGVVEDLAAFDFDMAAVTEELVDEGNSPAGVKPATRARRARSTRTAPAA